MAPVQTQRTFSAGSKFPETTPDLLRLYSMRFCPFAQRARLVLAHKNIKFETVNVNLKKKPDWFLARNPFGATPAVELNGKVVYESAVVCNWLDDAYPQKKLTPADPYRKARDGMLAEYFGKFIPSFYTICFGKGDPEKNLEDLKKHYKFFEEALAERSSPYFGGSQPAMIDFIMWPFMERVAALLVPVFEPRAAITKDNYPHLAAWCDTMSKTPAVQATMFDAETHQYFWKTYTGNEEPDYDYKLEN